jgi:hypothetical protein
MMKMRRRPRRLLKRPHSGLATKKTIDDAAMIAPT